MDSMRATWKRVEIASSWAQHNRASTREKERIPAARVQKYLAFMSPQSPAGIKPHISGPRELTVGDKEAELGDL